MLLYYIYAKTTTTQVAEILERLCCSGFEQEVSNDTSMLSMNWISKHREDIKIYYAHLIDVGELVDKGVIGSLKKRESNVSISFNQLFLIHREFLRYRHDWHDGLEMDDPLLKLLAVLGPAPENVANEDNHTISLRLPKTKRADDNMFANELDNQSRAKEKKRICQRLKRVLLNKEKSNEQFIDQFRKSLFKYLIHTRDWARNYDNSKLFHDCELTITMINGFIRFDDQDIGINDEVEFNKFLFDYVNEIGKLKDKSKETKKKLEKVLGQRKVVVDHIKYLNEQIAYQKKYLENVHAQTSDTGTGTKKGNSGKDKIKRKTVKFGHKKLVSSGVIVDVDQEVIKSTKSNPTKFVYYFTQVGANEFEIDIKYKVKFGSKISPFSQAFQISLIKLLEMREQSQSRYVLEFFTFSVDHLIHLLNENFVK